MRIGLICRIAWPVKGGLTWHALRLGQELKKTGHELEIISRFTQSDTQGNDYFWRNEESRTFNNEGVTTHVIGLNSAERLFLWPVSRMRTRSWLLPGAREMVRLVMCRRFLKLFGKYDIIHYDGGGVELMSYGALSAARRLRLPFLVQPSIHINQWGHLPIDHKLFRRADGLLVHTNIEKQYLINNAQVKANRIYIVSNGIDDVRGGDADKFKKQYSISGRVILFLGRRSHDKGYFILHEAFKLISGKFKDIYLVVIGPKQAWQDSYVVDSSHPGRERIIELDYVDDESRKNAFAACDIFCQPSIGESFGLVFLEAALCGKAVIARNLEVLDELLGRFNAARLIGRRNGHGLVDVTPNEVAEAITELIENNDMREAIARNGIKAAENHLWHQVVNNFIKVYQNYNK